MSTSTAITRKKIGNMLELRTMQGQGETYLFIKDASGSYHALVEVDTKKALRACGATGTGATRQLGRKLLGF